MFDNSFGLRLAASRNKQ